MKTPDSSQSESGFVVWNTIDYRLPKLSEHFKILSAMFEYSLELKFSTVRGSILGFNLIPNTYFKIKFLVHRKTHAMIASKDPSNTSSKFQTQIPDSELDTQMIWNVHKISDGS